jgi:hypothetical protein
VIIRRPQAYVFAGKHEITVIPGLYVLDGDGDLKASIPLRSSKEELTRALREAR